jgi:uncharacterized protein (TIGR00369 family)
MAGKFITFLMDDSVAVPKPAIKIQDSVNLYVIIPCRCRRARPRACAPPRYNLFMRDSGHDTRYVRLQKNFCFACGLNNPDGMRLKFVLDEDRNRFVCGFRLSKRYTGPPGHAHGGIIATILDEAMGKVNKLRQVVALTSQITVHYSRPVPLNKPLRVESYEVSVRGRRHTNTAEILNQKGEILARSRGLFIAIDPQRMFSKQHTRS